MKDTITSAATASLAIVSSLLSSLPPPQIALPAVMIGVSVPSHEAQAGAFSTAEIAIVNPQEPPVVAPENVRPKIKFYAQKYGASEDLMVSTVSCETAGTFDPTIRSQARYTWEDPKRGIVKGEQEQSYGLSQIHIPDNPGITVEQAVDADFALDFMARALARGETWRWHCIK